MERYLEDLENLARRQRVQLVMSNSHAVGTAQRLGVPLLRAGFPQYDWVGGFARAWVGYRGSRQALFDLANLLLSQHHDIQPYRSRYWSAERDGHAAVALAEAGMVH